MISEKRTAHAAYYLSAVLVAVQSVGACVRSCVCVCVRVRACERPLWRRRRRQVNAGAPMER